MGEGGGQVAPGQGEFDQTRQRFGDEMELADGLTDGNRSLVAGGCLGDVAQGSEGVAQVGEGVRANDHVARLLGDRQSLAAGSGG